MPPCAKVSGNAIPPYGPSPDPPCTHGPITAPTYSFSGLSSAWPVFRLVSKALSGFLPRLSRFATDFAHGTKLWRSRFIPKRIRPSELKMSRTCRAISSFPATPPSDFSVSRAEYPQLPKYCHPPARSHSKCGRMSTHSPRFRRLSDSMRHAETPLTLAFAQTVPVSREQLQIHVRGTKKVIAISGVSRTPAGRSHCCLL